MTEPPINGTKENPQVVQVEGAIPANVVIRIFVIGLAFVTLLAIGVPLAIRWHDQDTRIREIQQVAETNRKLVAANGQLQRDLRQFVSDQCVEAESRDVVNVQQNLAMIRLLDRIVTAESPPQLRADVEDFKQALRDANATLEPEGEKDCQPGPDGGKP